MTKLDPLATKNRMSKKNVHTDGTDSSSKSERSVPQRGKGGQGNQSDRELWRLIREREELRKKESDSNKGS